MATTTDPSKIKALIHAYTEQKEEVAALTKQYEENKTSLDALTRNMNLREDILSVKLGK